jgi:DNA-binding transcriptional LysR family regulator
MWEAVELRELRVFLTLADELHFTRTAQRLGLSQSRVSQALRTLELRVGGRLFERTSRRVRLTPLGEGLRDRLAPAYEQLLHAFGETRDAAVGVAGTVGLGMYTPVSGGPHLTEIIRRFEGRHPECRVQLVQTELTRDQFELLRSGELDALAMRLPFTAADVVVGPILSREERVVAVAADHPLAARSSVSYDELGDETMPAVPALPQELMDAFVPPVTSSGKRIRRADLRSTAESMMRVATGELVHPTVRSFVDYHRHPGVAFVPIHDLPPSETALVWLDANTSPRLQAFVRAAADVLAASRTDR